MLLLVLYFLSFCFLPKLPCCIPSSCLHVTLSAICYIESYWPRDFHVIMYTTHAQSIDLDPRILYIFSKEWQNVDIIVVTLQTTNINYPYKYSQNIWLSCRLSISHMSLLPPYPPSTLPSTSPGGKMGALPFPILRQLYFIAQKKTTSNYELRALSPPHLQ